MDNLLHGANALCIGGGLAHSFEEPSAHCLTSSVLRRHYRVSRGSVLILACDNLNKQISERIGRGGSRYEGGVQVDRRIDRGKTVLAREQTNSPLYLLVHERRTKTYDARRLTASLVSCILPMSGTASRNAMIVNTLIPRFY
ncbi:hypothetical protein IG631_18102 [Alternaria alternata]|nr:hypothetical protein IG631_18102 [Alternaria alternata]